MPDLSPRLGGQTPPPGDEPSLTGDRAFLHALEMLNAPDEQTRLDAALLLTRRGDNRGQAALETIFTQADQGNERILTQLDRIVRDLSQTEQLRERAALAMARLGSPALPYLTALVDEADERLWRMGLENLGSLAIIHQPEFNEALNSIVITTCLHSDCLDKALAATNFLGMHSGALPHYMSIIRDPDTFIQLRMSCVASLIYFNSPEALAECRSVLLDTGFIPEIRATAAGALVSLGRSVHDETVVAALADAARDAGPIVRAAVAQALIVAFDYMGKHTATRDVVDALLLCVSDTTPLSASVPPRTPNRAAAHALEILMIPHDLLVGRNGRATWRPQPSMNEPLHNLYEADLHDHRQGHRYGTPDYVAMRQRDSDRRARVAEMRESGLIITALDHFHAARIMQHGDTPDDTWEAHLFAMRAVQLGEEQARWLAAASYDRWRMVSGEPQKYGTQYVSDGRRQRLWDVDPSTTDADRARWNVPPLADQLRKAEEATRIDPPATIPVDAPGWLTDAITRWRAEEGW
jgi:HEAT repeat protein